MASPAEKLAVALEELKGLQDSGVIAIKSAMLSRTNRERILTVHQQHTLATLIAVPIKEEPALLGSGNDR
jgi:hypothetical protein